MLLVITSEAITNHVMTVCLLDLVCVEYLQSLPVAFYAVMLSVDLLWLMVCCLARWVFGQKTARHFLWPLTIGVRLHHSSTNYTAIWTMVCKILCCFSVQEFSVVATLFMYVCYRKDCRVKNDVCLLHRTGCNLQLAVFTEQVVLLLCDYPK